MTLLRARQILNRVPKADDWYRIRNEHTAAADVYLYDEIGIFGTTAAAFMGELQEITSPSINLHISSLGGDAFDGIAIYNALRTHPARIVSRVDSMAASIASVIAQAGDHRVMLTGSQMMIHNAHGLAMGEAQDHRDYAEMLDKQSDLIASIYAERAGGTGAKARFVKLMGESTLMNAEETVTERLADEVVKPQAKPEAKLSDEVAAAERASAEWQRTFLASAEIT